ncbi:MAG: flgG [Pseudoduganella sp.]|jgi:flagellar basal-body rod protein FlgG|nr:flgG [Pseudoduganella sp.]
MSKIEAIAAMGMQAHKLAIETIANNIANSNTTGYKAARVSFPSLLLREGGLPAPAAGGAPNHLVTDFSGGKLSASASEFDVAIQGGGLFEVRLPDGSSAYTRGGRLQVNQDGMLATAEGWPLKPGLRLPDGLAELVIGADGKVLARGSGQSRLDEVGQLELAQFGNPGALRPLDHGLYAATEASGEAVLGTPGRDGLGSIAQQRLEGANVNMVEEMVNLMAMQRAYEALAKVVQANEAISEMSNNLRK